MPMDRDANYSPKPSVSPGHSLRAPLTPRVAGTTLKPAAAVRPSIVARVPATGGPSPRGKPQGDRPSRSDVTSRTVASRVRAVAPPSRDDPSTGRTNKSRVNDGLLGRGNAPNALNNGEHDTAYSTDAARRPLSATSNKAALSARPPGSFGSIILSGESNDASVDNRFFRANDMPKQESAGKRPDFKKAPSFFYADGIEDVLSLSQKQTSPGLSTVSENRVGGSLAQTGLNSPRSPPIPSISPSTITSASSFFPPMKESFQGMQRSQSPTKENIHLSYRKGASQILGMRSIPSPTQESPNIVLDVPRQLVTVTKHRKSTSLSSLESGVSKHTEPNRTAATDLGKGRNSSDQGFSGPMPYMAGQQTNLPSIDTSLATPPIPPTSPTFSPTKHASELAAQARRERKVLDLEISNSSLLAINASLERELRRQKAELKRFKRLSRAGRLSMNANGSLRTRLDEDEVSPEDDEYADVSRGSGNDQDYQSDSDDGSSLLSGGDALTPDAFATIGQDRLAKDEKRLQMDLDRHRELLVQSQGMNQTIKRCMYATEDMIREGKKALAYHVRVSDVKLGGRILTGHEDDDLEVEDESSFVDHSLAEDVESRGGLIDVWSEVASRQESAIGGDRDSGIGTEKPDAFIPVSTDLAQPLMRAADVEFPDDYTNAAEVA